MFLNHLVYLSVLCMSIEVRGRYNGIALFIRLVFVGVQKLDEGILVYIGIILSIYIISVGVPKYNGITMSI